MSGDKPARSCPTPECQLNEGHPGNCSIPYVNCPTGGCTLRAGHGGKCNAEE